MTTRTKLFGNKGVNIQKEKTKYKEVDGTFYDKKTPNNVINILERLRNNQSRIKIYYGDNKTGKDWEEKNDNYGRIGRSTGKIKIPLLINNQKSMGGEGILTKNIVKIKYANKKDGGVIYQHPKYYKQSDLKNNKGKDFGKKKFYVTMTDKFMSGWGRAEGKTNKFVVGVNTYEQAKTIQRNAKKRNEMKFINITTKTPYYNPKRFLVSRRVYKDLGEFWKE